MYERIENRSGCWYITKAIYFIYMLYWAWGLEAFRNIGGYLIPLGMLMAGVTLANYFVVDQRVAPLFPFSIKVWLIFCMSEVLICFVFSENFAASLNQLTVLFEIIIVLICCMAICVLEDSIDFVVNVNRVVYMIYAISMLFLAEDRSGRLTLYNSNTDATVCLAGIVLTFITMRFENRIRTIVDFGIIGYLYYCILATGSRKAFICATLFIAIWMFVMAKTVNGRHNYFDKEDRSFFNTIFGLFLIIVFAIAVPAITSSYAFRKLLSGGDETSDGYRVLLYREAWDFFRENPIFGIGYGLFRYKSSIGRFSHSTYAEILSCCGLYGTILYFLPYMYIARNLITNLKLDHSQQTRIRNLTFAIYFVIMLFLGTGMIHFYNEKFMVMFAIMTAFIEIQCPKEKEKEQCKQGRQQCSYIRG